MFTINPFAEFSASISPAFMQTYVIVMIILVAGGTLFDVLHKGSARYFFDNWRDAKKKGTKQVGGVEMVSVAIQTAVVDVAASGEFCNPKRRVAHLLTMYGFLAYVISTATMVFGYATAATTTPTIWPFLWHIGALMVCIGGYWFWFFIRVDVAAEGLSVSCSARGFIRPLAACECDPCLDLVRPGSGWCRGSKALLRVVHHRNHVSVRIRAVVKVCAYVLQTRGGTAEKDVRGGRLEEQTARAGRQTGNLR